MVQHKDGLSDSLDTIEPSQFLDLSRSCNLSREQQLIFAVLKDGLEEAQLAPTTERKKEFRAAALSWLSSRSEYPMSFQWCCDAFGLDSTSIREAMSTDERMHFKRIQVHSSYIATPRAQYPRKRKACKLINNGERVMGKETQKDPNVTQGTTLDDPEITLFRDWRTDTWCYREMGSHTVSTDYFCRTDLNVVASEVRTKFNGRVRIKFDLS